jgi:CDP-diacylglycerol--glycerol-3-phosphate 3-phosphatidyltransferase
MATMTEPGRTSVWNLPNVLTLARLGLALVLFVLIDAGWWGSCIVVFALAAVTDYLDGYFARLQNLHSDLGRNLDPLVDKVLICGVYIFLLPLGRDRAGLLPWMVTVVVGRELIVTSLRSYMERHHARFGADWLGKLKMGLQCAAVFAIFVVLQGLALLAPLAGFLLWARDVLVWAMLAATALSGAQYLWRAFALLRADPES